MPVSRTATVTPDGARVAWPRRRFSQAPIASIPPGEVGQRAAVAGAFPGKEVPLLRRPSRPGLPAVACEACRGRWAPVGTHRGDRGDVVRARRSRPPGCRAAPLAAASTPTPSGSAQRPAARLALELDDHLVGGEAAGRRDAVAAPRAGGHAAARAAREEQRQGESEASISSDGRLGGIPAFKRAFS